MVHLDTSEAIVLVEFGELVATNCVDGGHGIVVRIRLLLEDVESCLVLAEAGLETMLLSLAILAAAQVETPGAEFMTHCSEGVPFELAVSLAIRRVVHIRGGDLLRHDRLIRVRVQISSNLPHFCFFAKIN